MTITGIMAGLDCMDYIKAIGMDRDKDRVSTNFQKRFDNVQWGDFKGLTVLGLRLMTPAKLF